MGTRRQDLETTQGAETGDQQRSRRRIQTDIAYSILISLPSAKSGWENKSSRYQTSYPKTAMVTAICGSSLHLGKSQYS